MKTSAVAAAATKGAAPNVDDNDADNEVKARAAQEGRMLGSSDWQDAAVQRNHRAEGLLCDAHVARTRRLHSEGDVRQRRQKKKKGGWGGGGVKVLAIKVQSCSCTAQKRVNKLYRRY